MYQIWSHWKKRGRFTLKRDQAQMKYLQLYIPSIQLWFRYKSQVYYLLTNNENNNVDNPRSYQQVFKI